MKLTESEKGYGKEKRANTKYEARIAQCIQNHFGQAPCELIPIPAWSSIVYEARFANQEIILKAGDRIGVEVWTCQTARKAGVKAPEVLFVDTSQRVLPLSYFIMRKAKNGPLIELEMPLEREAPYLRETGHQLRQLHTIPVDGFGQLDWKLYQQTGKVRGTHETWEAFVFDPSRYECLTYLEQNEVINHSQAILIRGWIDVHRDLIRRVEQGRLLHGDLDGLHIFVNAEELTCLIDFGTPHTGDPVWDLWQFSPESLVPLLEGYQPDEETRKTLEVKF